MMDRFDSARDCIEHVREKTNRCSEEWKPIVGYEGLYEISCSGVVRRMERWTTCRKRPYFVTQKELRWQDNGFYHFVVLRKGNKSHTEYIHRLLYEAFVGLIPNGKEIDHINRDGHDNRLENLRVTDSRGNKINRSNTIRTPCVRILSSGRWQVGIYYKGVLKYLGTYDTPEEGTKVYQEAVKQIKQGTFEDYYETKRYKPSRILPSNIEKRKNRYYVTIKKVYYGSHKTLEEAIDKVNKVKFGMV